MFSPYYAWARGASGRAEPENHVALNIALYGPRGAWAMTERGRASLARDERHFSVGPSAMAWDGTALTVTFDERSCPIPRRLSGTIRLIPEALGEERFPLDAAGLHRWTPLSPRARVEVSLTRPSIAWSGHGYLATTGGDEPLARGFARWDWARAEAAGEAAILYDATRRDGTRLSLALRAERNGTMTRLDMPSRAKLPTTRIWRIGRATHGEGGEARVLATLEDTPFYARSVIGTRLLGREATAVHERLDLDRFASAWVTLLLPFRMPKLR